MIGDRVEVELTGLAHGGQALGRLAGKIVFVPYGAPGDRALVELVEERKGWARGRLVEILEPSVDRVEPRCPSFGQCPGCELQHIAYEAQLRAKREIVRDQMVRLGGLKDIHVREVIGMADPWHYRNQARLYPTPDGRLGLGAAPGQETVALDACPLYHPLIEELFGALELEMEGLLSLTLRAGTRTGDQMIIFETEGDQPFELEVDLPISAVLSQRSGDLQVMIGDEWLTEDLLDRSWKISAPSPFPANTEMAERMVCECHRLLDLDRRGILVDAGSGIGIFSLPLSEQVQGLLAVEEDTWAVDDFQANAGEATNVGIIEGPLVHGLSDIEGTIDLAIVHPARSGLRREGATELGRLSPVRVVYETDDPATLARDVAPLQGAGYRLKEVQPIDLLPQSPGVSVLALWERT